MFVAKLNSRLLTSRYSARLPVAWSICRRLSCPAYDTHDSHCS